jgi:hypothetical protein
MLGQQAVERRGVEFAQRVIGRVGKIDHHEIVRIVGLLQPRKRIGVDDVHARIGKRVLV